MGGQFAEPWWGGEPTLATIGDISITQNFVVTPSGTAPIGQTHFTLTDLSRTTERIPAWAIVLAVVFFLFCLLGLLFLLVKETRTEGSVQVVVQGPRLVHTVQLPVWSPQQVFDYHARVNYARAVAAAAQ